MSTTDENRNMEAARMIEADDTMSEMMEQGLDLTGDTDQTPFSSPQPQTNTPKRRAGNLLAKMKAAKEASPAPVPNPSVNPAPGPSTIVESSQTGNPPATQSNVRAVVEGSNIGSQANEPEWTQEQLNQISTATSTRLESMIIGETRRSVPDPGKKYLEIGDKGTVITKPAAYLPKISTSEYKLGLGKGKPDQKVGKARIYSDIVMLGTKANFVLNQWTSMNVIMEGVPQKILDKPTRTNANGRPERKIGHDFARVGLPKASFGPVFETLRDNMPGLFEEVSVTRGYYWLNASWGVTASPGNFIYKDENGMRAQTHRLYDAMKRIMGHSSMGVATIAISISDEVTITEGKPVASGTKYQFSIKLHNMFHMKNVPYRSPPQASATGFEVSDDMFEMAESLSTPSVTSAAFNDTAGMFTPGNINPFASASMNMSGGSSAKPYGDAKLL